MIYFHTFIAVAVAGLISGSADTNADNRSIERRIHENRIQAERDASQARIHRTLKNYELDRQKMHSRQRAEREKYKEGWRQFNQRNEDLRKRLEDDRYLKKQ